VHPDAIQRRRISATTARSGRYDAGVSLRFADQPLIFLDVDGPLIPLKARPLAQEHRSRTPIGSTGNPLLDRLAPQDGHRLLALGCPLAWATTWGTDANEIISPRLALPELPVVDWPDDDEEPQHGLHWKTMYLIHWAAGHPFVWLDDEITDTDRRWTAAHHPERALLRRVDPYLGLTPADFAVIHDWLRQG